MEYLLAILSKVIYLMRWSTSESRFTSVSSKTGQATICYLRSSLDSVQAKPRLQITGTLRLRLTKTENTPFQLMPCSSPFHGKHLFLIRVKRLISL